MAMIIYIMDSTGASLTLALALARARALTLTLTQTFFISLGLKLMYSHQKRGVSIGRSHRQSKSFKPYSELYCASDPIFKIQNGQIN